MTEKGRGVFLAGNGKKKKKKMKQKLHSVWKQQWGRGNHLRLQNSIKQSSSLPATVGTIGSEIMVNAATRYERRVTNGGSEKVNEGEEGVEGDEKEEEEKKRQNGSNDSLGDRTARLGDSPSVLRIRCRCFCLGCSCNSRFCSCCCCCCCLECAMMCVHFGFDCCHSAPQGHCADYFGGGKRGHR